MSWWVDLAMLKLELNPPFAKIIIVFNSSWPSKVQYLNSNQNANSFVGYKIIFKKKYIPYNMGKNV